MIGDVVIFVLSSGLAFIVGALVTLIVCERSMAFREKRQALRQRELAEVSNLVNAQLRVLATAKHELRRRYGDVRDET